MKHIVDVQSLGGQSDEVVCDTRFRHSRHVWSLRFRMGPGHPKAQISEKALYHYHVIVVTVLYVPCVVSCKQYLQFWPEGGRTLCVD